MTGHPPGGRPRRSTVLWAARRGHYRRGSRQFLLRNTVPLQPASDRFPRTRITRATAADYGRFLQMLVNKGELDGKRLLSRKTVELMTSNHIGGQYIDPWRQYDGDKFGLSFGIRTERGQFD